MRLQSAIFDMDGTLLDSMPTWRELGPAFLREAGIPATPEQEQMLRTMTDHEVIPYLREVCGLPWSEQEIMDKIIARMEDFYSTAVRPKPGLEKFLSILKMEGVWMYVATATHRRLTEKALKTAGIDHYFRGIVTSADAGNHKSESADIYEMAMRRLQSNKRDTVVFEDALHAIRTAKANDIDYTLEIMEGDTGTNAWTMQIVGRGIACALLSIPQKYMHTPVEVVHVSDVEATAELIAAYVADAFGGVR